MYQSAPPEEEFISDHLEEIIKDDQVITISSYHAKVDMDHQLKFWVEDISVVTEVVTVSTLTSTSVADAAAVQALASNMSGTTAPESNAPN